MKFLSSYLDQSLDNITQLFPLMIIDNHKNVDDTIITD